MELKSHRTCVAQLQLDKAGYRFFEKLFYEARILRNYALQEREAIYAQSVQRFGKRDLDENPRITAARKEFLKRTTKFGQFNAFTEVRRDQNSIWNRIHSNIGRGVLEALDRTWQNFFRRIANGEKTCRPRFKTRGTLSSIEIQGAKLGWISSGRLKIKGLPRGRLSWASPFPALGRLKSVRIVRRGKKFELQVVFEIDLPEPTMVVRSSVGIDMGVIDPMVDSDGNVHGRDIPPAPEMLADGKDRQRKIDDAPKGSRKRRALCRKLGDLWRKEGVRSNQACHRATTEIVRDRDMIADDGVQPEKMSRKGGVYKKGLNRGMRMAQWGRCKSQIRHKAQGAGARVYEVNPAYTSQECSGCGKRAPKKLSVRVHECSHCGLVLGRDHNAARNVLFRGEAACASDLRDTGGKLYRSPVGVGNGSFLPPRGGPGPDGSGASRRQPPGSSGLGEVHAVRGGSPCLKHVPG